MNAAASTRARRAFSFDRVVIPTVLQRAWSRIAVGMLVLFVLLLFPDKPEPLGIPPGKLPPTLQWVEEEGRFANTILQVGLPVLTRDLRALCQLGAIAVTSITATHGLKRALNDVQVDGIRLGQRPASPRSKHNVPSGHASLAASGALFVCTRYGWKWGWLVWPILVLTLIARVALDAHTITGVLTGAVVGLSTTWAFVTRRREGAV